MNRTRWNGPAWIVDESQRYPLFRVIHKPSSFVYHKTFIESVLYMLMPKCLARLWQAGLTGVCLCICCLGGWMREGTMDMRIPYFIRHSTVLRMEMIPESHKGELMVLL
jgi:hypothetical protein